MNTSHKLTYAAAAALMLLAGACSEEQSATDDISRQPMRAPVLLTIATDGGSDNSLEAERYIDDQRLFIATYNEAGQMIEPLYTGGTAADGTKWYPEMADGPQLAFHIDKSDYCDADGSLKAPFYIVAYAIPANTYAGNFDFVNALTGNYELQWPSTVTAAWAPTADDRNADDAIPMAGYVKVTQDDLEGYDADLFAVSPYRLPNPIRMTRAMAKVVIEDPDGIVAKAEFTGAANGLLIPSGSPVSAADSWWPYDGRITAPTAASTPGTQVQTIGTELSSGSETDTYTFYAYELDFTGKAADAPERGLIKLTADPESGLTGSRAQKEIYIAPYTEEGALTTDTYDAFKAKDNGAWTGLLRNHIYTFTINKPAEGELEIYVKVGKWVYEKSTFEF